MKKILVLCTGNSCRSQMAEAYLRYYAKDKATIYSAGTETHGLNPKAIQVMKEDGIDISFHTSNKVNEYSHIDFDYIITVCEKAKENCPYFTSPAKRTHHNFPDPSKAKGSEQDILQEFRRVRDKIKTFSKTYIQENIA